MFFWCHIRHLNPLKIHPERITKVDKKMINDLDYEGIKFPVSKNDYCRIERQNNICINVLCYENGLTYPVYLSDQKCENCMDLLLIIDENKPHCVYIKDFNRFMCSKTKNKNKKYFCKDFFRLMNDSVFGKTMDNLRKRISVKLVNNAKDYARWISKPSFV